MIKTTQFIQLSLLMLLLFALFQFSSYSISFYNRADNGNFHNDIKGNASYEIKEDKQDILVISGNNDDITAEITQELSYMKRGYSVETGLLAAPQNEAGLPEIIILAAKTMKNYYDLQTVQSYLKKGVTVIFAVLPIDEIDEGWKEVLGIEQVKKDIHQEGIIVFDGFFIGGRQDYQKIDVEAPYIKTSATCKTFIVGYKEKTVKSKVREYDYMYDIVWRNRYQDSQIYVVSGNIFEKYLGSGVLSAIFAQIYPDYIYPVINAKALVFNNSPFLSEENQEEMMKRYSRNAKRLLVDLILPNIISISLTYNCAPTFYGISSFDYKSTDNNTYDTGFLPILSEDIQRIGGEIGISAYDRKNQILQEKLKNNISLFGSKLGFDKIKSLNTGNCDGSTRDELIAEAARLMSVASVVTGSDKDKAYFHEKAGTVYLPVISRGFEYSEEEYFKLQNMATALGVICQEADMKNVIFPERTEDDWTQVMMNLSSMLDSYWNKYQAFDGTNISDMSKRTSRFLEMKPYILIGDTGIQVSIEQFEEQAFFILRTRKKITGITGGSYQKIEDGIYLISADTTELSIKFDTHK